jgi:hypothetical protein
VQLVAVAGQAGYEAYHVAHVGFFRSTRIRFVYSNPDYNIRLGADARWAAAQPFATVN